MSALVIDQVLTSSFDCQDIVQNVCILRKISHLSFFFNCCRKNRRMVYPVPEPTIIDDDKEGWNDVSFNKKAKWLCRLFVRSVWLVGLVGVMGAQSGCVLPSARVSAGASVVAGGGLVEARKNQPRSTPNPAPTPDTSPTPGFALDVMFGAVVRTTVNSLTPHLLNPEKAQETFQKFITKDGRLKKLDLTVLGLSFMPELGYSLDSQLFPAKFLAGFGFLLSGWHIKGTPNVGHLLSFILPGYWAVGYIPYLVLAGNDSGVFPGLRNTLYAHVAGGLLSFELQYELYPTASGLLHSGRVMVGVNLGLLLPALILQRRRRKKQRNNQ